MGRQSGAAGEGGDSESIGTAISSDGRFVAFASSADNLSDADDNAISNVFLRDALGAPTAPAGGGPVVVTPPPASTFAIKKITRTARGGLIVTVKIPAPGSLALHATAKTARTKGNRARKKITVARARRTISVPRQLRVTLKPSRAARKALAMRRTPLVHRSARVVTALEHPVLRPLHATHPGGSIGCFCFPCKAAARSLADRSLPLPGGARGSDRGSDRRQRSASDGNAAVPIARIRTAVGDRRR